ncbi:helix-turn-helix transcriptional regulator [Salmonella enterica]|uniref:Helix-turn-helix transcriptional regulator n=1 Tax=Salmonella enterica TaxID=28901 RepID=A0A5U2KEJ5_SALER|nr:helix-turn-helix transcriptional regulator [Salmonella enterica]EBV8266733.1 XRE family transcriptional regulator [Salmonella enterica subsp. enterica serovar Rubislaw]ECX2360968.1 helix-turn-helix transcriptional regulator [Salmonella enterica subsp. enterica serovar Newport]ECX6928838.1 helix-turn-helix transcriptional regulator [Salmonella enterica subsp. enterica serovar Montevideo]EAM8501392.1 XRE family transcriptional regulator [Salmonella enterica]EAS1962112.1 XRE family transcripti
MVGIGVRIREERKRLKLNLTQAQAAMICGISREMWGKYERGQAMPGGDVLLSFAEAGADIQYILLGEVRLTENQEEKALLENYRAMNEAARLNMQAVSAAFAQANLNKDDLKDGSSE